jgi:hypothetical protein
VHAVFNADDGVFKGEVTAIMHAQGDSLSSNA